MRGYRVKIRIDIGRRLSDLGLRLSFLAASHNNLGGSVPYGSAKRRSGHERGNDTMSNCSWSNCSWPNRSRLRCSRHFGSPLCLTTPLSVGRDFINSETEAVDVKLSEPSPITRSAVATGPRWGSIMFAGEKRVASHRPVTAAQLTEAWPTRRASGG